jgi:hypothetical protein
MLKRAQQFNGREAKTATLLKRRLLSLCLSVAGFCPRHLNRYASILNDQRAQFLRIY